MAMPHSIDDEAVATEGDASEIGVDVETTAVTVSIGEAMGTDVADAEAGEGAGSRPEWWAYSRPSEVSCSTSRRSSR